MADRLEANAERHFRKRRVRAFKLLKLFCSLVRAAAAGRVKGLQPPPCLRSDGKAKRGAKRKEGEWNGRKPLKPTEHNGDVVFSKEKRGEERRTIRDYFGASCSSKRGSKMAFSSRLPSANLSAARKSSRKRGRIAVNKFPSSLFSNNRGRTSSALCKCRRSRPQPPARPWCRPRARPAAVAPAVSWRRAREGR